MSVVLILHFLTLYSNNFYFLTNNYSVKNINIFLQNTLCHTIDGKATN